MKLFVPADAAAQSVGADEVAEALQSALNARGLDVPLVRTGSRGLTWLEPLVEVNTAAGRQGFANVTAAQVPGLLDAIIGGEPHASAVGLVESLPALARQRRLTFSRVGVIDPLSLEDFRAHGGLRGWARAMEFAPEAIVQEVTASGLRGRGGAGFPAGLKWKTVAEAPGARKYIVCNADEGDSGTFADRMVMEGDPFMLLEGMRIAARAVGASHGFIYVRSEYPRAVSVLERAITVLRERRFLGADFDVEVRVGAGAYVCGEETSLLESLEGKRGQVRAKPPLPAHEGLFGKPTVVNNVLTLAAVPWILEHGGAAYAALGVGRSRGTMPIQLGGNVKHGGLFELPLGLTLRELIFDFGGGTASGRPVRAVQVGGPLGAYFPEKLLDTPLDYEAMAKAGGILGHAGVVVFDDTVDLAKQARFAFEFCALESCGKCTPCRIGSTRGVEVLDQAAAGVEPEKNLALVKDLCTVLTDASLCALGGLTPLPVLSALEHFHEDFTRRSR
ncbi:MAG: NADH-ubiquinone oxidoreductase-F iron-sulfur binding region domain-containing protein [Myxococcaceae bacterium]